MTQPLGYTQSYRLILGRLATSGLSEGANNLEKFSITPGTGYIHMAAPGRDTDGSTREGSKPRFSVTHGVPP